MKKGRILMKISVTVEDTFGDFIMSRKAKGLSDKTLVTYKQHFAAIAKFFNSVSFRICTLVLFPHTGHNTNSVCCIF